MNYIVTWSYSDADEEDYVTFKTEGNPWDYVDKVLFLTSDPLVINVEVFYINKINRVH